MTIPTLALALLPITSCTADGPVAVEVDRIVAESAWVTADEVTDLTVVDSSTTTLTVSWTQVDDGGGKPASYQLRYDTPTLDWDGASIGCSGTIRGDTIGEPLSCVIEGLDPGTAFEVQVMSYRSKGGKWKGAVYSNVTDGRTMSLADTTDVTDITETRDTTGLTSVQDLSVVASTPSTLTVRWTQIDDGTGQSADYRVKYALPPISWREATTACSLEGDAIGAELSCELGGLAPETTYDVQLMSYRAVDGVWHDAFYSNVVTGRTAAASGGRSLSGIWIGQSEIDALPTEGAEWEEMVRDAGRDWGLADISDQDSHHDVYTLAGALVCARTGEYCDKARQGVVDAIGTEDGARWLAVGRNLGAYVIAADVLGLRADGTADGQGTRVEEWMEGWLTRQLQDNNDDTMVRGFGPFHAGANAAAQEGFVYAAVAAYLGDEWALQRAWDGFRTFACDPGAPDREEISLGRAVRDGWAHDDASPCAVNPAGAAKEVPEGSPGAGTVHRIDGALIGDMKRGGTYRWTPGYTSYPWVGLEGFVPAAMILSRAGYPAFEVADRAVLRTHEYLWFLRTETGDERWFDGMRARQIVHLVNVVYDASFPVDDVTGRGRTVGYTDWTHPGR